MKTLQWIKGFVLLFLSLSIPFLLSGASKPDKKQNEVKPASALELQLDEICGEFCLEIEVNNDDRVFDSLAYKAIQKAEASFDHDLILKVNLRYLEKVQLPGSFVDYKKIAARTELLTLEGKESNNNFKNYIILSQSASRLRYSDLSHRYALKAFSEASMSKDPVKKVSAYLAMGKSLQLQQLYVEAYQNLLNAYYHSELISQGDVKRENKILCYQHISSFFGELNDFEQAAENKNKEIHLLQENNAIDSTQLFWAKLDLYGLAIQAKKYYDLPEKMEEIIQYSIRSGNQKMKDYTFASYRTFLLQNNDFQGFKKLYVDQYPDELERMRGNKALLYLRIKAYIAEYEKDLERSLSYYKAAEKKTGCTAQQCFQVKFL